MIDVSIILVNYNTKKLLIDCINSVYKKTSGVIYEIIVVDNNSHDGTEESIKTNFPDINFIQSGDNIGFGRANNLGIKCAKADFIFLLNSDTLLVNNAIKILFDYIVKNPNVGVCGGNLYTLEVKPTVSFNQSMPGFASDLDVFLGGVLSRMSYGKNIFFNHTNRPMILNGYVSGADMMIRKEAINAVGLFDSDFFMYYEETELTWRIKKENYKVASVPDAKIIHLEGASETIKENTIRRMIKSKYLYFEKTNKKTYAKLSFYVFTLTAWSRVLFYSMIRKKISVDYWIALLKLNKSEHAAWNNSSK
jgi:GT2 family glycosyltransferase